jgi:DNA-binding GntR family transcriptional regulator
MIHRDQAGRPLTRQDHAVHRAVVSMSGNRSLLEAWSGLDFPLHVSRRHAGEGVIDHTEALREHDAIVDALLGGDPRRLAAAVEAHTSHAEGRLVRCSPPSRSSRTTSVTAAMRSVETDVLRVPLRRRHSVGWSAGP